MPRLQARLARSPMLKEVNSDWQDQGLVAYVNVNRDSASRLGIAMQDVDNALYNAFGQRLISTIYTQSNQYRVVLEQARAHQDGLTALQRIYLTAADGSAIPLASIATVEQRHGMLAINHLDQFPSATLSFNVPDGYTLEQAIAEIDAARRAIGMPANMTLHFQARPWRSRARWTAPCG